MGGKVSKHTVQELANILLIHVPSVLFLPPRLFLKKSIWFSVLIQGRDEI